MLQGTEDKLGLKRGDEKEKDNFLERQLFVSAFTMPGKIKIKGNRSIFY